MWKSHELLSTWSNDDGFSALKSVYPEWYPMSTPPAFRFITVPLVVEVTMSWRAAASSVASARTLAPTSWIWSLLVKSSWSSWCNRMLIESYSNSWAMRNTYESAYNGMGSYGIVFFSRSIHSDFFLGQLIRSWAWQLRTGKQSDLAIWMMNSRLDSYVKRAHEWQRRLR